MKIKEILDYLDECGLDIEFSGREEDEIHSFSPLSALQEDTITWIKNLTKATTEIIDRINHTKGLLVITCRDLNGILTCNRIFVSEPKMVFFMLLDHFYKKKTAGVISSDSIIETKKLGSNVSIGHHCFINKEVEIGDDVCIDHNVSIVSPCRIGKGTIIHSGAVIGTDGFGYYKRNEKYCKVPHFGGVVIGEDVEIGANTCIDRGTMEDTVIGDRVKIDNLCHIGHNVTIGSDGLVIAVSVLGGSCRIGEHAYIAPGAVIKNQVTVGNHALVGMGAVVIHDVESNKVVAGVPAHVLRENE